MKSLLKWLNSRTKKNYWDGFLSRDDFDREKNAMFNVLETMQKAIGQQAAIIKDQQRFIEQQRKVNSLVLKKTEEIAIKNALPIKGSEVIDCM